MKRFIFDYREVKAWLKTLLGYVNKEARIKSLRQFPEFSALYENIGLPIKDPISWKKAFKNFILVQPDEYEVATAFYQYPPELIKAMNFSASDVILITLVKNELYRMKKFLEHYRDIGFKQFAIIDNQSSDGTREFLLNQDDVEVFSTNVPYNTNRREAWINRIIAFYGFDRWYFIADSDELAVFSDVENHGICDLIAYAESQGMFRVRGMLLDMYSESLFTNKETFDDPYLDYVFFDTNTYTIQKKTAYEAVTGGFRKRIFHSDAMLTKYPLIYFKKGDIQGKSHFPYPYSKNLNIPCLIALKHYKFLPRDIVKYRKIANEGNYFNGSIQYKNYIKIIESYNNKILLSYEGTRKYTSSKDLAHITCFDLINWNK